MNVIQNSNVLKEQYKTSDNLNKRISIHEKYSTNKLGFGNWITSKYEIKPNSNILELGCGTGDMWTKNLDLVKTGSKLILTDLSKGMLESAKSNLGDSDKLAYQVVDIQNIPFDNESFDLVIANMMLYHVPDLNKGLLEVKRVLKPNGKFYCATFGENGIIQYIEALLTDLNFTTTDNKAFTLQNGMEKLSNYFTKVDRLDYKDSLAVTNINDLIDYIYSLSSMTNVNNVKKEILIPILENKKIDGVLNIPKEYGMFVCEK